MAAASLVAQEDQEAQETRDTSAFMAEPVTPASVIHENGHDMKIRMEMMIMKIQVNAL